MPTVAGARSLDGTVNWASIEDDLDIVRRTQANLLVIGPDYFVTDVIRRVIVDLPANFVSPCKSGQFPLSLQMLPPGTLVLRDIDELGADSQALLFDWLDTASADRQIVCTASELLLPLVHAGAFDHRLYYRLNTFSIRLGQ